MVGIGQASLEKVVVCDAVDLDKNGLASDDVLSTTVNKLRMTAALVTRTEGTVHPFNTFVKLQNFQLCSVKARITNATF